MSGRRQSQLHSAPAGGRLILFSCAAVRLALFPFLHQLHLFSPLACGYETHSILEQVKEVQSEEVASLAFRRHKLNTKVVCMSINSFFFFYQVCNLIIVYLTFFLHFEAGLQFGRSTISAVINLDLPLELYSRGGGAWLQTQQHKRGDRLAGILERMKINFHKSKLES